MQGRLDQPRVGRRRRDDDDGIDSRVVDGICCICGRTLGSPKDPALLGLLLVEIGDDDQPGVPDPREGRQVSHTDPPDPQECDSDVIRVLHSETAHLDSLLDPVM